MRSGAIRPFYARSWGNGTVAGGLVYRIRQQREAGCQPERKAGYRLVPLAPRPLSGGRWDEGKAFWRRSPPKPRAGRCFPGALPSRVNRTDLGWTPTPENLRYTPVPIQPGCKHHKTPERVLRERQTDGVPEPLRKAPAGGDNDSLIGVWQRLGLAGASSGGWDKGKSKMRRAPDARPRFTCVLSSGL